MPTINQQTGVTLAIFGACLAGVASLCFWAGTYAAQSDDNRARIDALEALTVKTNELATDNKRRLDFQEGK